MFFPTSLNVAPAVLQILVKGFQVLLRVKGGFFEMI
jgi:hypothetical protein